MPLRQPLATGAKRAGIAIVATAVAVFAIAVVIVVADLRGAVSSGLFGSTPTTPVDQTRHLSAGKYVVYEHTGASGGVGGVNVSVYGPSTLTPGDVQVTDDRGVPVATHTYTSTSSIIRGQATFAAAIDFRIKVAGDYRIQIVTATPVKVIIAQDLGTAFAAAAPWFGVGFGGLVLLVVGIVVLVRGPRRRT